MPNPGQPTISLGATGGAVRWLQRALRRTPNLGLVVNGNFASPGAIDGSFGPNTKASVQAFQTWGGVAADGIVGDQTWAVSLHAASATLETAVGLQYAT
jgi:peptidoglycan hydrolase-like protein with peptidoglycan-binding domain